MRSRRGVRTMGGILVVLAMAAGGCHEGVLAKPYRVGVTKIDLIGPQLLPKWQALQADLQLQLGRLVLFDVLTPRQIRVHLGTGRLTLAIVDPIEYAQIAPYEHDIPLAVAVDPRGRTERRGLIVTAVDSKLESLAELRGKRFDFGPATDPLLEAAAIAALWKAGVKAADLQKDPLFGPYHHIDSAEVARAVIYEKVPAGIVDESDYNAWPDKGGSVLLRTVAKDQLRVLHRCDPVPETVVLASKEADAGLVAKLRKYFCEDLNQKKLLVVSWSGYWGFQPTTRERYASFTQIMNQINPPPELPGESEGVPATTQSHVPASAAR